MNIFLWILQIFLALHTVIGAIWKFSNPSATTGTLSSIPHSVWILFSIVEFLAAVGLVLPAIKKSLGVSVPVAAFIVLAEMLLFSVINLTSGNVAYSEIAYWMVVAVIAGFIAIGRLKLKPF